MGFEPAPHATNDPSIGAWRRRVALPRIARQRPCTAAACHAADGMTKVIAGSSAAVVREWPWKARAA
jgi:hypothetical protein